MDSFDLNLVDEKSLVGSQFMARVVNELRRAAAIEKASRKAKRGTKITQQAIAEKVGTTRAVINRQMQGLENLSARRIAEILWALGWEPYFKARKIPDGVNYDSAETLKASPTPPSKSGQIHSEMDGATKKLVNDLINQRNPAPTPVS